MEDSNVGTDEIDSEEKSEGCERVESEGKRYRKAERIIYV